MRRWVILLLVAFGTGAWGQSQLVGKFVLPTLGPVKNGTLQLQLSQAAQLAGSYQVAPAAVSCYTSVDGSVVGEPNPQAAPTATPITGVGTLGAGTYYVKLAYTGTWLSSTTSTLVSPEAAFTLTAAGEIIVNPPTLQPAAATGYAVYIGTLPGTETLQGSVSGFGSYGQSAPLGAGAAAPGSNNTVCTVVFNDGVTPTGTWYAATLEDAAGDVLAGFPRNWALYGSEEDVGTLQPLASSPQVSFPMPVLARPSDPQTPQSIAGSLDLNGYPIHNVGNLGPGYVSFYWAGAAPAAGTALWTWTPEAAIYVQRIDVNAQVAGSGGSSGMTITLSDGTSTCSYGGQLIAAAGSSTLAPILPVCSFNAGVPVTVKLAGDDHSTEPQGLNVMFEVTAK